MHLAAALGEFIADTSYDKLDKQTVETTKIRIIDTLGAAFAGSASWQFRDNLIEAFSEERGGARVFCGAPHTYTVARAAMINATLAHSVELDDGHKQAGVHAGAVIVPTALTLGAALGSSGREIIEAVAVGYEIVYRLAVAESPWLIKKGFHPSATCGTLGAAAAASKLMKLGAEACGNALGMAGLFAGGLMEATVSAQESKCVMVGHAAGNGISAAYTARGGIPGATAVFEGPFGLFFCMSQDVDIDEMLKGLGSNYTIGDTYSKFYPTCRHSQPPIEAMIELIDENGFKPGDISGVDVAAYKVAYDLTGKIFEPASAGEAKFSTPYGVAAAALDRCFTVRHLTAECYKDPRYAEIARRVNMRVDDEVEALYPKKRGIVMTVKLNNGQTLKKECYDLRGSPTKPVSDEDIIGKFRNNAVTLYKEKDVEEMLNRFMALDAIEDMSPVVANICK